MHFFTITHSQDLTDISAFSGGPFSGERELSLSFVLYYFMESFFFAEILLLMNKRFINIFGNQCGRRVAFS